MISKYTTFCSILLFGALLFFTACNQGGKPSNEGINKTVLSDSLSNQVAANKAGSEDGVNIDSSAVVNADSGRVPLVVVVKNLAVANCPVIIGVYGVKNKFLDTKDQLKEYKFNCKDGRLTARISDLDYGELAFAIYQDVNNDGTINKNMIGIPTEPYAFSNNYKPAANMRAPTFKDCKFEYTAAAGDTVEMSMIRKN